MALALQRNGSQAVAGQQLRAHHQQRRGSSTMDRHSVLLSVDDGGGR